LVTNGFQVLKISAIAGKGLCLFGGLQNGKGGVRRDKKKEERGAYSQVQIRHTTYWAIGGKAVQVNLKVSGDKKTKMTGELEENEEKKVKILIPGHHSRQLGIRRKGA